ncbi:Shedu anti-phage system protein SduA domain-containing protein [Ensifer soli]|uniref:Shedu anti-phage system protein SduA domain-containing protein n=1 Tax=Ciceribacter sp. sgz301302 TaxID=3342379 RepID=UPI0035B71F7B
MALVFAKTYEMATPPASAMHWDEYAQIVEREWHELLNSPEGQVEANIQAFLERHPCMVPGGQSMSGPSGHSCYPCALIAQPKLPGFNSRIPDFMWVATDSGTTYAVVIEIEAPSKRWFRKDGQPTAAFTQAQNQLTEWRMWFEKPRNQDAFLEHYCGPSYFHRRTFLPQYVLIFGRRAEFEGQDDLAAKRPRLQRSNEYYMTFDRLRPIKDHEQYMTVKFDGTRFRAVSMPPTIELGPSHAEYRLSITGKEDAVSLTPYVSDERKNFLKQRFPYWDEWARQGAKGMRQLGDRE